MFPDLDREIIVYCFLGEELGRDMCHVHILCRIFFIDESSDLEFSLYSNTLHNVFVKIYIYIYIYTYV